MESWRLGCEEQASKTLCVSTGSVLVVGLTVRCVVGVLVAMAVDLFVLLLQPALLCFFLTFCGTRRVFKVTGLGWFTLSGVPALRHLWTSVSSCNLDVPR